MPEVHGVDKGINPHFQHEKQTLKPVIISQEVKTPTWKKPRLGQGKAGLRRKVKVVTPSQPNKPAQVVPPSERQKSEVTLQPQASIGSTSQAEYIPLTSTASKQPLNPKLFTREVPSYPDPKIRPPPRPPVLKENQRTSVDLDTEINTDFCRKIPNIKKT